jgi:hypothetical protein
MYVVVEFNQASHWPSVYGSDCYSDRADAEGARDAAQEALIASGSGRRERYAVAQLLIDDAEEG